jgi:TolB-like protein
VLDNSIPAQLQSALGGRYRIERELGRGGMATVYLAEDLKHARPVAIKVLRPDLASGVGADRFLREITIAGSLDHPHILQLHDSGAVEATEGPPLLYYVMPYVQGESLRARLDRESQLPVGDAISIACQVADALDHANGRGVVHRDVKPENILLASGHALVSDFGIAHALDTAGGEKLTATGLALGTPAYMSPEQASGSRHLDGRSDVYGLGCVLYEMLAGQPPFTGSTAQSILARHAVDPVPSLRTVRSTVPLGVEQAILRAMAKVPADRFATAGEFAKALTSDAALRAPVWRLRSRVQRTLTVAGFAAVVGIGSVLMTRQRVSPVLSTATSIAVLPFLAPTNDTALVRLGKDLATTVSASLDGVGGIHTADRLSIATETGDRPGFSAAEGAALARRLRASSLLRGTLVRAGDQVRLDLGLYRASDLAPLAEGIVVTGQRDSLGALTDSATLSLLRQVWQRGDPPSPSLDAVTTRSLPALRAFLDGERELGADRWEEAALAYRSAIAADSTFDLARFQYVLARAWMLERAEPEVLDALRRHRDTFPERERLLMDAFLTSPDSGDVRIERHRLVTQRFPDYWPGWFLYADMLIHAGPIWGHDWSEGLEAFRRVVVLDPKLVPGWEHIFELTVGRDSAEASRALARLTELGWPEPQFPGKRLTIRFLNELGRTAGVLTPELDGLADSMARQIVSSKNQRFSLLDAPLALLQHGFPAAQLELNRRTLRLGPTAPHVITALQLGSAWSWAARGQWDSALSTMGEVAAAHPGPFGLPVVAVENYGMAVLGAWLGATAPTLADERRPAALAAISQLDGDEQRQEGQGRVAWLDGILGFTRGDSHAIQAARRDAARSAYFQAELIDRSLAAFARALSGDRKGAGRDMAALEQYCLYHDSCNSFTPQMSVQRLAAGEWLREAGAVDTASRLLRWQDARGASWQGWWWTFNDVLSGPAYLARARLAETQGSPNLARQYYAQFLQRYDQPMPSQYHLVQEARAALDRLGRRP